MKPEPFGYKTAWFAIKNQSAAAVASALELTDLASCSWADGVASSHAREERSDVRCVFVTSPIDGWVMAVGPCLTSLCDLRPPGALDRCIGLSRALNGADVQYFMTLRVVDAHGWARARGGLGIRSYVTIGGEVYDDFGGQSSEEKSLGFGFFNSRSAEAKDGNYYERTDLESVDEEHVMRLAAAWSVDPSQLEERSLEVGLGLFGRLKLTTKPSRPWWRFW